MKWLLSVVMSLGLLLPTVRAEENHSLAEMASLLQQIIDQESVSANEHRVAIEAIRRVVNSRRATLDRGFSSSFASSFASTVSIPQVIQQIPQIIQTVQIPQAQTVSIPIIQQVPQFVSNGFELGIGGNNFGGFNRSFGNGFSSGLNLNGGGGFNRGFSNGFNFNSGSRGFGPIRSIICR